ncbi:hypothetical protein MADMEL_73 [Erwinia phage vB_EamM_MadMel]|uniref:Uncharacterized protein n=2 Tax=Agricanvirus TaxID=1984776 RepID=A0A173GD01_9CAUD|nr:hypothetical protein FDH99_gp074 [Erwinia phage vB_EamM_Simmy50]ANH51536.1 hypothetical protein SIMMY50_74 [Erwinia phage vB_EamM_Simmy50]AUG86501.1 hypothetical protein MADMEL_73 [Erwinia phage vB_EamM_MadMel]
MKGEIETRFRRHYGNHIKRGSDIAVPLYHISLQNDLEGLWRPKAPDSPFDIPKKPSIITEMPLPRICVAPSIEQCFWAIYPNISKLFEEEEYAAVCFAVYQPILHAGIAVVDTSTLTQCRLVHDAHITGEHWLLSDTTMCVIDFIQVNNTSHGEFVKFHPFNTPVGNEWELAPKNVVYHSLKLTEL